jgi:hypothetical protein
MFEKDLRYFITLSKCVVIMGSFCPVCDQFVNNLDDCELPYGGAPAPNYYYPSSPTYVPSSPTFFQENLDVLENPYYVPPLLPAKFRRSLPIFFCGFPPAYTTRSNTMRVRTRDIQQKISPLLREVGITRGVENKLEIVDKIYVILKDNMDVLKKNVKLYDISKSKLDEFIEKYPEAGYLKTLRHQMFD